MSKVRINNGNKGMLGLWLEPWGEDYWIRPDEAFTVVTTRPAALPLQGMRRAQHGPLRSQTRRQPTTAQVPSPRAGRGASEAGIQAVLRHVDRVRGRSYPS